MTYDSKPFPDDGLHMQMSEDRIARAPSRSTTAHPPGRPEPSGFSGRTLAVSLQHAHSSDSEFDLISDAQFASGMNGACSVSESNAKAIVFIDSSATDINAIVRAASMDAEIVMLDAKSDGIVQIADHLQSRTGVERMHIVCHGVAGELQLGTSTLSLSSITGAYRDKLAGIASMLAPNVRVTVCGCEASADAPGEAIIHALADVTGAYVSGSDDPARASVPSGDSDLEISQRVIGTFINVVPDWTRFLAPPVTGNEGLVTVATGLASGGHRRMA